MTATPGFVAVPKRCGRTKCHKLSLALYRVTLGRQLRARFIGAVPLRGNDQLSVRQALARFPQLTDDDTEALLEVQRLLQPPPAA